MSLKVPLEGEGFQEFETNDGLFTEVSKHLSERFRLAFTAHCYSGKLLNGTGFIGDTLAAQQILEKTYILIILTRTLQPNFFLRRLPEDTRGCQE